MRDRRFAGLRALVAILLPLALIHGRPLVTRAAPPAAASAAPSGSVKFVAPKLLSDAQVDYPKDASGDAVVDLLLVIEVNGTVRSATASVGEEPFASAAIAAAKTWKFEPATRNGVPIVASIPFRVTFTAPVVTPPPAASTSASTASSSAPPPSSTPPPKKAPKAKVHDEPIEVVVQGDKPSPTVTSFAKAEVRELPGAFGDPFRAIEVMPGVTPIVSGLPFFYVRGAPPGNVGYFLDGIRVPYLYHVGLGPSVIHPGMVDRVDLYPGGYPARFGRYAGGIVAGETTAPRPDFHGESVVRIFDLGVLTETGFHDNRGTALLGFRYSYTAAILSLIAKGVKLDYRDIQARLTYDLTEKDKLTLFGFGAYDLLQQEKNDLTTTVFGSEFYRGDLRYDHTFSRDSTLRFAVTVGWDQTKITELRNVKDRMMGTRLELRHAFSPRARLRAGLDVNTDAYSATEALYGDKEDPSVNQFNQLFPARTDYAGGMWAEVAFDFDRVELTPGVRVDYFKSVGATATGVDPRISARFKVTDKFRIVHAYGLAHQPPSFVVPVPGLVPASLAGGLQTSFQTSAGIEADLPASFTANANLFHNAFFSMTDAIGTRAASNTEGLTDKRSTGEAYGLELFVRRRLGKRFGGFLSYTLSRSTRSVDGYSFPAAFDRTHVLTVALAYDLGRNWRFGARHVFYTGAPVILQTRGLIAPPPSQSPDRDPPFYRVDARLEKRWWFNDKTWLAFVMEMLNCSFRKETISGNAIGPVTIPSFGVEGAM